MKLHTGFVNVGDEYVREPLNGLLTQLMEHDAFLTNEIHVSGSTTRPEASVVLIFGTPIIDGGKDKNTLVKIVQYVSAPFDAESVREYIHRLLRYKHKGVSDYPVGNTYERKIPGHIHRVHQESKNKKFLRKVVESIETNYQNPEFDVPEFALSLGISKTLLNRRLQELIGQSTGKYIRNYRLRIARDMILLNKTTKDKNISEIAYEVGFNDPKYFARCFREYFGELPSQTK